MLKKNCTMFYNIQTTRRVFQSHDLALSKQSPVPPSRVLVELLVTKQLFLLVEGNVVIDGYFPECFGESFGTKEIHEGGSAIHLCTTL